MKFVWNDSYSVGVKKFDEQHQQFFKISNEIYQLIEGEGVKRDVLFTHILELINYSSIHLSSEESAFHKYEYPEMEGHLKHHSEFRTKIQGFLELCMDGDSDIELLAGQIVDYASKWLAEHILNVDKKYSEFLQGKEIE